VFGSPVKLESFGVYPTPNQRYFLGQGAVAARRSKTWSNCQDLFRN